MKKLQIPENIPLHWELWHGFGRSELLRSLLITGSACAVCVLFCLFSDWGSRKIASVLLVVFTCFICAGFFSKMDNNQSIYTFLQRGQRYKRHQQSFLYKREQEEFFYAQKETT